MHFCIWCIFVCGHYEYALVCSCALLFVFLFRHFSSGNYYCTSSLVWVLLTRMSAPNCNGSSLFSPWGQSRAAMRSFSSPVGDHNTLVNVYRASVEYLEKTRMAKSKKTTEKHLKKWCRENFINYRSLKHACDIHRWFNLIFVWKIHMLISFVVCVICMYF